MKQLNQSTKRKGIQFGKLQTKKDLLRPGGLVCQTIGHKNLPPKYVCVKKNCYLPKMCCSYCLQQAHYLHQHIELKQLDLQLGRQSKLLAQLLQDKLRDLEQDERASQKINQLFRKVQQQFYHRINAAKESALSQIVQIRRKIVQKDQDFTFHYQRLTAKLSSHNRDPCAKAQLLGLLYNQNSTAFYSKAEKLHKTCNRVSDQLLKDLDRQISMSFQTLVKAMCSLTDWSALKTMNNLSSSLTQSRPAIDWVTPMKRPSSSSQRKSMPGLGLRGLVTNKALVQMTFAKSSQRRCLTTPKSQPRSSKTLKFD